MEEPTPSRMLRGEDVLADPLVRELLGLRTVALLATIWDETGSGAELAVRDAGAALPLERTASRRPAGGGDAGRALSPAAPTWR